MDGGTGGDSPHEGQDADADPLLAAVGRRVRETRVAAELGVIEAARRIGVHNGYLHRVEAGQQNLSLRSLAKLAHGLGTSMSALLEGVPADPIAGARRPYRWQAGKDVRPKAARKRAKAQERDPDRDDPA